MILSFERLILGLLGFGHWSSLSRIGRLRSLCGWPRLHGFGLTFGLGLSTCGDGEQNCDCDCENQLSEARRLRAKSIWAHVQGFSGERSGQFGYGNRYGGWL